ncbi:MAG TPA: DinB family protein [Candidatus Sulfomarinibacteraceae bacterium]|nr:DinB family protein [Candidatus Sulfomarinibacteraceae bacterium]
MPEKPLPIEQILTILGETPPRIATLTDGLKAAQLHTRPAADEWSANDVLAHLRSCADVWGGCIARILAEDEPTIRAVNPVTWMKQTDYPQLEFRPSFEAFTKQRAELLAVLEALAPESWTCAATVTGAGKPLVRTVHSYAQWMARHERPHVKQIARVVNVKRA